jgi:hypothetical protein
MLSTVSRHATRALVSWSGPTRRRQVIGSLLAAAVIVSWWAPTLTPAVEAHLGHPPTALWQVQLRIRQVTGDRSGPALAGAPPTGELSSGPAPRSDLAGLLPGQLDLVLPGAETAGAVLAHNLVPVVALAAGAAFFAASRRGRARRAAGPVGA